ncbi:FT-interacting protein 3-like [Lolium perenne]|uniref:FT-interacting protein 3-like n=1 Tax=Lolium perenne TaxID=4522 RepID=UPI0021EAB767|nr:FT-interacting protein 3-like isoform X1 [Lolium perenne]XP_051191742.1 FT-interacting protein 3-like isoform X2 [Lolium perenne]
MAKAEKLVVEVVAAHNLMPKDGQGSSSPYVEVEFDHQKRRTRPRPKDLNPVWNERLLFPLADPDDLPYRAIDVAVYNDRASSASASAGNGRNFLGKVRVPAAGVPAPGEPVVPQLFTLEKRSLFSHIRGEITLKIYRTGAGAGEMVAKASKQEKQAKAPEVVAAPPLSGNRKQQQQHNQQHNQQPVVPVRPHHPPPQQQQQPQAPMDMMPHPQPAPMKPVMLSDHYPAPPFFSGPADFALKETRPSLGGGLTADKASATYDLVEQMQYLYVRVVRARGAAAQGGEAVVAEVKLGNYRGVTPAAAGQHQSWDQVFAFSKETIQSSFVEIFVRARGGGGDDHLGRLWFDLSEVPRRAPPDSTLAPQWYAMEDRKGERGGVEVMVAVWYGTQADEAFGEAWHSRAAAVQGHGPLGSIKSKVYVAPKLWYLRVSVIEAQDLLPMDKQGLMGMGRYPELFVRAQIGSQMLRTRPSPVMANRGPSSPFWNEDLMFVVAEPFEEFLVLSLEDHVSPGRDDVLGRLVLPVSAIERRWDEKLVVSRWFGLDRSTGAGNVAANNPNRFGSRVHLRLSLDGGYHVLDEATAYSSDLRPTAKQLWHPHVGVLELGVLGASGLIPMKAGNGRGATADSYCVAKYGQKWIRTRTVVDSVCPRWNEQYTWEVFDPCTVITVGVFDNCHVDKPASGNTTVAVRDNCIGKVRIRLSTLETDRVYTHAYPLLMLHPSGVKKMGELHLAVRFGCGNAGNMYHAYVRPLLPKMHYVEPLLVRQVESLRFQATSVVAARLGRTEPPLGKEVVEYMLDHRSHLWSMRRSKANFFRLVAVLSGLIAVGRWFELVRSWQHPVHSCVAVFTFLVFVLMPELILPTAFLVMAFTGLWRYRVRPRNPPHMDMRLSHADAATVDELDEEFDTFPSSRGDVVRFRYDRLRSVAGRVQTVVGDIATQGERMQAVLSWRDPRATLLFSIACVAAAVVAYAVPMKVLIGLSGLYAMRPPRFRSRMPSLLMNFFRRLPSKADILL